MMKYIFSLLITCMFTCISYSQNKSITIYNNGITHDNISAAIFNNDTTYYYSVTTAALWTGKLSTKIIYKGNLPEFMYFMNKLLAFAEENKDNIGASECISGINIKSVKKMGIKCISIGSGKDVNNTTTSSIKNGIEALINWIINN